MGVWNIDPNGNIKFSGNIEDLSGFISIDQNAHKLYANDGSTLNVDYSVPGTVNFGSANLTGIGSISPSTPLQPAWDIITSTTVSMSVNTGYGLNCVSSVNCSIPAIAPVGSEIKICDMLGNGFSISQPSGVYIVTVNGNTTTGVSGNLTTTSAKQSIYLVCLSANTVWQVVSSEGVFNIN